MERLNSKNDNLESLAAYTRRFAKEFLDLAGIKLQFVASMENNVHTLGGYKRRRLYLSIKELLNNAVKHAGATIININMQESNGMLTITVKDNGKGLPDAVEYGNGLKNMQQNMEKINGNISFKNDNGLVAVINVSPTRLKET